MSCFRINNCVMCDIAMDKQTKKFGTNILPCRHVIRKTTSQPQWHDDECRLCKIFLQSQSVLRDICDRRDCMMPRSLLCHLCSQICVKFASSQYSIHHSFPLVKAANVL